MFVADTSKKAAISFIRPLQTGPPFETWQSMGIPYQRRVHLDGFGCFQPAGTHGLREGLIVLFVLFGVAFGEVRD